MTVCADGVEIIISVAGDPTELVKRVHDCGGKVFHDVTSLRFAEKAIAAAPTASTHRSRRRRASGTITHLALIPRSAGDVGRHLVLAGAVSTGAAIRAAEILGADLAYLGTRFIATQEAAHRSLQGDDGRADLHRTWSTPATSPAAGQLEVKASIRRVGLDPDNLPKLSGAACATTICPPASALGESGAPARAST